MKDTFTAFTFLVSLSSTIAGQLLTLHAASIYFPINNLELLLPMFHLGCSQLQLGSPQGLANLWWLLLSSLLYILPLFHGVGFFLLPSLWSSLPQTRKTSTPPTSLLPSFGIFIHQSQLTGGQGCSVSCVQILWDNQSWEPQINIKIQETLGQQPITLSTKYLLVSSNLTATLLLILILFSS